VQYMPERHVGFRKADESLVCSDVRIVFSWFLNKCSTFFMTLFISNQNHSDSIS
jgi:hypothetical protein